MRGCPGTLWGVLSLATNRLPIMTQQGGRSVVNDVKEEYPHTLHPLPRSQ